MSRYAVSKRYGPTGNTLTTWAKEAGMEFSYQQVNLLTEAPSKKSILVEKYHG